MRRFCLYFLWTAVNLKHLSHRTIETDNLLQRMQVDMDLRNLSEKTKQIYLWQVRTFARHYGRSPRDMGVDEIRAYLHHLIVDRNLSQDYIKQVYSALKLLYETTLDKGWDLNKIPHAKQRKKLPVVLSQQQVCAVLEAAPNLKYHALFMTVYSAGLRLSEAAHLRLSDIDSDQMRIRVKRWIAAKEGFYIPVRVLSTLFRGKFLALLKQAWETGDLHFPGQINQLACPATFRKLLTSLYRTTWNVYCKPPFGGPQHVMAYLAAYIHRTAISNNRILRIQDQKVYFPYRDSANDNQTGRMSLPAFEFIRRFLLHILPEGLVKIRHVACPEPVLSSSKGLSRELVEQPVQKASPYPLPYASGSAFSISTRGNASPLLAGPPLGPHRHRCRRVPPTVAKASSPSTGSFCPNAPYPITSCALPDILKKPPDPPSREAYAQQPPK